MEADISTSWFNQYFIKPLQGAKCSSYLSLVDLSIILCRVFFFASQCPRTNLWFTRCYFHVHSHQCNGCNRRFSGCLWQNVGELGYAISSCSASTGYLASMLTGVAKADFHSSTFSTLGQHLCQYPALPDHDSVNKRSVSCRRCTICKSAWYGADHMTQFKW